MAYPSKVTHEIRAIAQGLLRDEKYVKGLLQRLRAGTAPQVESLLWQYAYGKPRTSIEITNGVNSGLSVHLYVPQNNRQATLIKEDHHGVEGTSPGSKYDVRPAAVETDDAEATDESAAPGAAPAHEGNGHMNGDHATH